MIMTDLRKAEIAQGIYVASKIYHASMWRSFRKKGYPIISSWIDEVDYPTEDYTDLWQRCLYESSHARALVIFCRSGEQLKGAFIELGSALNAGVKVFAVGFEKYTIGRASLVTHCSSPINAMENALTFVNQTEHEHPLSVCEKLLAEGARRQWR
jgi:hypothetical protein